MGIPRSRTENEPKLRSFVMHDRDQSEGLTQQVRPERLKRESCPAISDIVAEKDEAAFEAGQKKVLGMIAANAP